MQASVNFLLQFHPGKDKIRVLEIGWGQGISGRTFLKNQSVQYEVVELHPTIAKVAREAIGSRGIVHEGSFEQVCKDLPTSSYDIIFFDPYPFQAVTGLDLGS